MNKFIGVIVILLSIVLSWYIGEAVHFLATLFKPMTPLTSMIQRIVIHVLLFALTVTTAWIAVDELLTSRRKKK